MRTLQTLILWLCLSAALLLSACGGGQVNDPSPQTIESNDPSQQCTGDGLSIQGNQPGVTPFIALLQIKGRCVQSIQSLRFSISPKPGSTSAPVQASFSMTALQGLGYQASASGVLQVPVFGLYPNAGNLINLSVTYTDASVQTLSTVVTAAPYTDPTGIYATPTILTARQPGNWAGFDFFVLKSAYGSPVIVDSDGAMRWAAPGVSNAISSAFHHNAFFVGSQTSLNVQRLELDGGLSSVTLNNSALTSFHHDMRQGKTGLLAMLNSASNVESTLVEFDPKTGAQLMEWDLAALISSYMQAQGDDPTAFVRPGIDWFHMNSAIYDPRDDSVIVSSRENFVIKLDYSSGTIRWILGDPSKYWYSFPSLRAKALSLASGGLDPIGQHALSLTAKGELLLFNDGQASTNQPSGASAGASRSYSAASAYQINLNQMQATETWRYEHSQNLMSNYCSSVYQLPNGGLLLDYAEADGGAHTRLIGLGPDLQTVFDFQYATTGCATAWNAIPIALDGLVYQ